MSFTPKTKRAVKPDVKRAVIANLNGGVCIDETHSAISDRQSPDMQNMWYENNLLCTRNGQEAILSGRAVKRLELHNLFPMQTFTSEYIKNLKIFHQFGNSIANNITVVENCVRYTSATYEGGVCYPIKLERRRRYLISAEVKGAHIFSVLIYPQNSNSYSKFSFTGITAEKKVDFHRYHTIITTGDLDYSDIVICGASNFSPTEVRYRNVCLFDITDAESDFNKIGGSFLTDVCTRSFAAVKKYETEFSPAIYKSQDILNDLYVKKDGSLALFSVTSMGKNLNCFLDELYFGEYYFHVDDSLYSWSGAEGELPFLVIDGKLADAKSVMFTFLSRVYVIDHEQFFFVSSEKPSEGDDRSRIYGRVIPYEPTVMINCNTSGVGDKAEDYNLIGEYYRYSYNTENNNTSFALPYSADLANPVTFILNNQRLTETSDYTINKNDNSKYASITLKNPITTSTAGMNNLVAIFKKNAVGVKEDSSKIFSNTLVKAFGGMNLRGTRIFLSGSKNDPSKYYRSFIHNCTYFPDMEYDYIGPGTEKITAFELQYGDLMVFTETSVYQMSYSFDGDTPLFSTKLLNAAIGCDMPGSVRLVDNKLVFANTAGGVYIIDHINDRDEKNIKQISLNINGSVYLGRGLLSELTADLRGAVSFVFGGRYFLRTGGRTYVWDYALRGFDFSTQYYDANSEAAQRKLVWYIFDNIPANFFFRFNGENSLGYITDEISPLPGGEKQTVIVKFKTHSGDFGAPIKSYFQTKAIDFGVFNLKKIIKAVTVGAYSRFERGGESGEAYGSILMHCTGDSVQTGSYAVNTGAFSFDTFCWPAFSFEAGNFIGLRKIKTAQKKAYVFALRFESVNGPVNISKVMLDYTVSGY